MQLPGISTLQQDPKTGSAPPRSENGVGRHERPARSARLVVLWLPDPLPDALPDFAELLTHAEACPDAIVLGGASGLAELPARIAKAAGAVVPTIGVSGQSLSVADVEMAVLSREGLALALRSLQPVIDRVRSLPDPFFHSADPGIWLLARLVTRQRGVHPVRDPASPLTLTYLDEAIFPDFLANCERLCRTGHLDRHFFDRLNTCPACASARLVIREECRNCRSSDIAEEPIIHHLRCAYQGPERDFRDGQHLTCPKCRARLEHFSVDYDKPGILTACNACGHSTGTSAVGYICLDCKAGGDTSLLQTRVVNSYELTERGRRAVVSPGLPLGRGGEMETLEFRQSVRSFVAEHRALAIACCVLVIRLDATKARAAHRTEAAIETAVDFLADVLRETFTPETEILRNGLTFTVLIGGDTPETIRDGLDEIRTLLERHLSIDLDPAYEVMAPEDFEARS